MTEAEVEQKRARKRATTRRYRERMTEEQRTITRERNRLAQAAKRAADPERYREQMRQYVRKWKATDPEGYREYYRKNGRRYRDKHGEQYRAASRERARLRNATNPDARRAISHRHILKAYGLTPAAFDAMVAEQKGRCAICGSTSSGRKGNGRLSIDHCHVTGVVRGLLCSPCNSMLGLAKDSAARLRAAADYLERKPSRSAEE